ncbi:enoyl-CoA hydratase [Phycicoccus sp. Soil802]|nr:enoyl-CoA hydratase [Phycicoccus sp. Soil802]
MAVSGNEVQTARPLPHVAMVVIARPLRRNALNLEIKSRIADLVEELDRDPSVRAIIITGGSEVFAAGTDVDEMVSMSPTDHTLRASDRMFTTIRQCQTAVIAAVEGFALGGGCELAMSCDLIVAGAGSRFGQPEIRVGVMPGAGATQRMVRVLGKYRALRLLLLGDTITGEEALAMGLVSEVVPDGDAVQRAQELASAIAELPPLAIRAILEVVDAGADVPLETALLLERKAFQLLFDSEDQVEGMRAFLEKRPPDFLGR